MKYIPSSKLSDWREANAPARCPIYKRKLKDSVVDHCHKTGMIRGIIDRQANAWGGKIENSWRRHGKGSSVSLPDALRNLADFLEGSRTDILHPTGLSQICKRFNRLSKGQQIKKLKELNCPEGELNACTNSIERTKSFRTAILRQCDNANNT